MRTQPMPGARAQVELTVATEHTAAAFPIFHDVAPRLPQVLATVGMVALLEKAAALVLAPHLDPHETSVGVAIDVTHEAATPVGAKVYAEAILKVIDGTKYVFEVIARDAGGIVGRGSHKRAVVSRAKLEAAAQGRQTATV